MSAALAPGSRHAIPIRHPDFPFEAPPTGPIERHWAGGNLLATHAFNALNLTFPDGERFFIRSVQDLLSRVDDPELVRQARAFAGQEAMHGREHEAYFDTLRRQGYEIDRFLARFQRFGRFMDRLPARLRVAITAGAEHYTATFGRFALEDPVIERMHPTMRALILWHATEEIEHKAVAFDVMQAVGVSYPTRLLGFLLATASLFGWVAAGLRMLLRQEGVSRARVRALRKELRSSGDPGLERRTRRRLLAYLRPGFHPNQVHSKEAHPDEVDDLALAHQRLAEIGLLEAR